MEARSFFLTEVKDMNFCRGKSVIMVFHDSLILMERTQSARCESQRSFEAHAHNLGEVFDGGTKETRLHL